MIELRNSTIEIEKDCDGQKASSRVSREARILQTLSEESKSPIDPTNIKRELNGLCVNFGLAGLSIVYR